MSSVYCPISESNCFTYQACFLVINGMRFNMFFAIRNGQQQKSYNSFLLIYIFLRNLCSAKPSKFSLSEFTHSIFFFSFYLCQLFLIFIILLQAPPNLFSIYFCRTLESLFSIEIERIKHELPQFYSTIPPCLIRHPAPYFKLQ